MRTDSSSGSRPATPHRHALRSRYPPPRLTHLRGLSPDARRRIQDARSASCGEFGQGDPIPATEGLPESGTWAGRRYKFKKPESGQTCTSLVPADHRSHRAKEYAGVSGCKMAGTAQGFLYRSATGRSWSDDPDLKDRKNSVAIPSRTAPHPRRHQVGARPPKGSAKPNRRCSSQ